MRHLYCTCIVIITFSMSIFSQTSLKFNLVINETSWEKLPIKRSKIDVLHKIYEKCPDFKMPDCEKHEINKKDFSLYFLSYNNEDSTNNCLSKTILNRYNLITFIYGVSTFQSMNYELYKNKDGQTILLIDIIILQNPIISIKPGSRACIGNFLVKKKYCTIKPIIYIRIHNVENYEIKE